MSTGSRPSFIDLFSEKADLYASARPTYPDALFGFVASLGGARERVWDCATGNGQAALGLAPHFSRVEATDASEQQLSHAVAHERVRYSLQPAEQTDFPSSCFDAVCVAQALHWFDYARFFPEVHRVLKPGGAFVAWGYDWFTLDPAFEAQFRASISEPVEAHWAPQNALMWNGYRDVPFPFRRVEVPRIEMTARWTFPQFLAYVHTWSAVRRCLSASGRGFFDEAEAKLAPLWGRPEEARTLGLQLHVVAGIHEPGAPQRR